MMPDQSRYWRDNAKNAFGRLLLESLRPQDISRNCLNCLHWHNTCDKFKQMPPPHIIVSGCDDYEDVDQIPF